MLNILKKKCAHCGKIVIVFVHWSQCLTAENYDAHDSQHLLQKPFTKTCYIYNLDQNAIKNTLIEIVNLKN